MVDPRNQLQPDPDPTETQEWVDSIESVVHYQGVERAHYLLGKVHEHLQVDGVQLPYLVQSPYVNTIPPNLQPTYPGDLDLEKRLRRMVRWNAAVMVHTSGARSLGIVPANRSSSTVVASASTRVVFPHPPMPCITTTLAATS